MAIEEVIGFTLSSGREDIFGGIDSKSIERGNKCSTTLAPEDSRLELNILG